MKNSEEVFVDYVKEDFVSPYKLSKILSKVVGKNLPPQMMYNYVKKNIIASEINSTGKIEISKEIANEWMNNYVKKNCK
tara:strand:+ start:100 stop:336 length:237 start_codon:yes stop_codon:yes gene_type:complete